MPPVAADFFVPGCGVRLKGEFFRRAQSITNLGKRGDRRDRANSGSHIEGEVMGLPSRVFWTLPEAALKWGRMPPDIAGWALNGLIELSAPVPPTECGDQVISGLVGV